jgi:hypothetical protein
MVLWCSMHLLKMKLKSNASEGSMSVVLLTGWYARLHAKLDFMHMRLLDFCSLNVSMFLLQSMI